MEHFDLEDMFGRRKKPKLALTIRLEGREAHTDIFIGIENLGRGTAKAPYIAFNITEPFRPRSWGLDGNGHDGLPKLHFGQRLRYRYGASSDFVIHPGTVHEVTAVNLGMNPKPENLPAEVIIDYEITAEDSQLFRGSMKVNIPSAS